MPPKYNFKRIVKERTTTPFVGFSVNKDHINISKALSLKIKSAFVEVLYDKERQAISLCPVSVSSKFSYKVYRSKRKPQVYLWVKNKGFPMGRYFFKEKTPEGYVCKHGENHNLDKNQRRQT